MYFLWYDTNLKKFICYALQFLYRNLILNKLNVHCLLPFNNHCYDINNNIKHLPNDDTLLSQLVRPLESYWGATDMYSILQSKPTAAKFCGKVFKNGEPAVFCNCVEYELFFVIAVLILPCIPPSSFLRDCQTDPTCCLCLVFWKQWTQEPSIPEYVCTRTRNLQPCDSLHYPTECFINSNEWWYVLTKHVLLL